MGRTRSWNLGRVVVVTVLATFASAVHSASQNRTSSWSLVQELVIGAEADGAIALTEVADIAVGEGGTIYVVQSKDQVVRVFAPNGPLLRTLGRRGRGPGEFQSPRTANWRGDTLVVADPYFRRLVGFLPSGERGFTMSFVGWERIDPWALLVGARVLGRQTLTAEEVVRGDEEAVLLYTADRAGERLNTLARLALRSTVAEVQLGTAEEPMFVYSRQPFATDDLWDVDPHGRWVVTVSRPVPERKRGVFTVTRYAPDGRTLWRRGFGYHARPLPQQLVRDTLESRVAQLSELSFLKARPRASLARAVREGIAVPRSMPPVDAVVAGRDGTTWLRRGYGATVSWLVLDETGRVHATVNVPADLTIHAADREHVWGVRHDENDAPYLVRYRVRAATR